MTHFPDNILTALKEAVKNVFWKRSDVRSLFQGCNVPQQLINAQDWNAYKYFIIAPVLDDLNSRDEGLGPLRRILQETLKYKDGDHLLWMSDGQKRKREAERSLEHLRLLIKDHDAAIATKREQREAHERELRERQRGAAFQAKLAEIKSRFLAFHQSLQTQRRGYGLETILYDLFLLFELEPKGPFRITGEQIDGAFVLDGDDFRLEAKWTDNPVQLVDLRDLDGAVASNLDNTLGLFVSINGFSEDALTRYCQGNRPRLICLDGLDLVCVRSKVRWTCEICCNANGVWRRRKAECSSRSGTFSWVEHDPTRVQTPG